MLRSLMRLFLGLFLLVIAGGISTSHVLHAESLHATPDEPFELGGQIFSFSTADTMKTARMDWVKMQISFNQSAPTTADAQNIITHGRNHGFKVLLSIKGNKSQLAS